ncbi:nicotinate phosphoribosyltransferase [Methanobrevibacter filiformis]|uniref:Nicotinamide phosphoribosyltransferase n=1 Tax=Methanobrevibacter filiformis TaxID=55758 RepID=A0A166D1W5_9EURY|nr:nicotinate phosphoribosyltransferase [Methanobrevibacter filiformis]KZX15118.1 putative nicotinate phosphoribosyltransferase [Methanobrevibacter filiformis]
MIHNNICLMSDSYKFTHYQFYPKDTEYIYSYLESRTGARFNKTVFFGLQYILKKYLEGKVVNDEKIEIAKEIINNHIGSEIFNEDGWRYILDKHDGRLPVEIKAIKEGTPVEVSNVLMTIVNTDSKCGWLTNYLESLLLQVWFPSTVATLSRECKILLNHYLNKTSDDMSNIDFMLHDFGYRGASSFESSEIAGAAHLINFSGTDTVPALILPMKYYNNSYNSSNIKQSNIGSLPGYSVQATEHSIMTSLGETYEFQTVSNILKNAKDGILSIVIDSYNYQNFIGTLGRSKLNNGLREEINSFLNRAEGNKIVFRPDSGDPVITTLDCFKLIEKYFGVSLNSKGYKIIPSNIGLLWGDGIDYYGMRDILFAMKNNRWAASNIIFGMGGGLHTSTNRDTQKNAFKSSAQYRNGKWHDVYKKPLDITKSSKKGRLALTRENDKFKTIRLDELNCKTNYLETVFKNGKLTRFMDFDEVKELARI